MKIRKFKKTDTQQAAYVIHTIYKKFNSNGTKKFENEAKKQNSEFIKIRSSLYAINFYERNGYKKTTGIRNFTNLKVQPMIKKSA